MISISLVTKEQSEQVHRLRDYCFSSNYQGEKREDFQYWIEHSTTIGAFDDYTEKLVGQLLILPLNMTIHNQNYKMGGIGFVATYPEYRNRGIMKKLMEKALEEMRRNQQAISVLAPFSVSFYRQFGWELFCDTVHYSISIYNCPLFGKKLDIIHRFSFRYLDEKSFDDIRYFHNEQMLIGTGGVQRDMAWWNRIKRREPDSHFAAVYEGNKVSGYIRYVIQDLTFHIKDFITQNNNSDQAIWRFIAAHSASINKIVGITANHSYFDFSFHDPQIKKELTSDVMMRIVDVEKFLKDYNWKKLNDSLYIEIEDPIAPWNEKVLHINLVGEVCHCETHVSKDKILALPINIFSALMVGYLPLSECLNYSKHKIDSTTIENWQDALQTSRALFNEYF